MRLFNSFLALVVASMSLVLAQSSDSSAILATIPPCALKCMAASVATSTCDLFDTECTCKNQQLQADIEKCVITSCTIRESLTTKNASMTMCNQPIRNRQQSFLVINAIMGILSGLFVAQRFATKFFLKLPFGLDDLFIGLSMLIVIPCIAINAHGLVPSGLGRDIWTIQPDQITNFGLYFYIMTILYFTMQTFLKLAMIFFFLRIFPTRGVRRALWATAVFNCLYGLVYIFLTVFQCRPINLFWNSGAFTIALDAWILSIPLSQLKKMNVDWKKKIGVGIMFSVGTFVTIVSILRLRATIKFSAGSGANNATWEYLEFDLWSTIEIATGVVCACLPSLRVLLVRIFPMLGGSSARNYYQHDSNSFNKGRPGRSRSFAIPLGSNSEADKTAPRTRIDPVGITRDRTYEVEFGQRDHDETELVHMKDLDNDLRSDAWKVQRLS
ncbi:hypothetical protein FIE12Z_9476 [Fusarium flagelliforme]|uniref:CFEM domain-containing protein n=1 Tax=Fusarium flagelliforme TaxID=2675880 RepID=A0A395MGN2_9HYPO|nr:hypothetical protein FIE12Z_9476 [Fusarium flagelliforme]